MKCKNKRSKFAQNRIDYIVYANPKEVSKLVYDYGYEPPKNPHDLVKAAKILVKKNGRKAIKDLIKIHPDRKAIFKIQRGKEDNFCGACSSYSYQPEDNFCGVCGHSHYDGGGDRKGFLDQLMDLGSEELEAYYESIVRKSNDNPEDSNLAEEVQMVWNELRQRKSEDKNQPEKEVKKHHTSNDGLIILGLVFVAGILIGSSLKTQ
jgi:hypothetical protein